MKEAGVFCGGDDTFGRGFPLYRDVRQHARQDPTLNGFAKVYHVNGEAERNHDDDHEADVDPHRIAI